MARLDPPPEGVIRLLHRLIGDDLSTDPEEVREYWTRPEVLLVLAALTGRYGSEQRLLVSDDAGRLQVVPHPGPGTGEARQIKLVTNTVSIGAGQQEQVTIGVPAGYYGWVRIDSVYAAAPSGATSGTQVVDVYTGTGYGYYAHYEWAHNAEVRIASGVPVGASASSPPAAQHTAGCMWYPTAADSTLVIAYKNSTDAAQANPRRYIVTCRWIRDVAGVSI
jgi:hypothetical protein